MGSAITLGRIHAPGRVEIKMMAAPKRITREMRTTLILSALASVMFLSIVIASAESLPLFAPRVSESGVAAQNAQELRELALGAPVEREIAGGDVHVYQVMLVGGQYLSVTVEQRGIDLMARLVGPGGQQLVEIDIAEGTQGIERLSAVAGTSGSYRLEILALRKTAARGRYEVRIEELREGTPQDQIHVAALSAYAEGKRLDAQGTAQARQNAVDKYELALTLWRDVKYLRGQAQALADLGAAFAQLGERRKGIEYSNQALVLWRELRDPQMEAGTLNSLGWTSHLLGENKKALEFLLQALPLQHATGDRRGEALTLNDLSSVYSDLGELQKSLDYLFQALPLRRLAQDRQGEASTLYNLGFVYSDLGEHQMALDYLGQSLPMRREVGDRAGEAYTLQLIGEVYMYNGELQRALEYYNQALDINRATGDRWGEAYTLRDIGLIYSKFGEYQKALEYFSRVLELSRAVEERKVEASALVNLGGVYANLGDSRKALNYYDQALALWRAIEHRRGEARTLHDIGALHQSLGDALKALDFYGQALSLSQASGDRRKEAEILGSIARAERDRGRLAEACLRMETALGIIESLRTKVTSRDLRASYFAAKEKHYEFYIDLLMRMHQAEPTRGYDAAALNISERARARSLLETLTEASADIRQGVDKQLLARERALQQQLNAKAERLTRLLSGKHTDEQTAALRQEVETLLAQYQEVQVLIRTTSPRYAALTQPVPLTLKEIQQQVLDNDTVLLEYALGEERSYLWAVTPTAITSFVLPRREEIETAARRAYRLLITSHRRESKRQAELAASQLSRLVIEPVAEQLGKKRLLIVSEGALQYIPFGALPEPYRDTQVETAEAALSKNATDLRGSTVAHPPVSPMPLIVNHEIVSLPSASTLAVLRREVAGREVAPKTLAVLADPIFQSDDPRVRQPLVKTKRDSSAPFSRSPDGRTTESDLTRSARESGVMTFERLRFTREEADTIVAQAYERSSLKALDFDAGLATVTNSGLDQYRIVHFATHGLLNSQHPELSGIVLSLVDEQGRAQDGFLRAHDIYNLKLRADLVVLSACQTALGKEIKGEGLAGLTRGFMYAGAARVVASLWDVKDEATAELMKRFYRGMLREGLRPAEALRAAQISMWKEPRWAAPSHWAGFMLQGEWR